MSEQDRYIPGVPCWVDTTQPDPEAAAAFYGGLFGWEFEDVMPPGSPGHYLIARLPGGDVAAVGSPARDAPAPAGGTRTCGWTDADETAAKVRAAGGRVLHGADRRRRRRAAWRSSPTPRAPRSPSGSRAAPRRRGRQRARLGELQRPPHARPRGRAGVLRRGLRLGAARHRRRLDVGAARLRRLPRASARPACARTWPRWARPSASRTSSRASTPIPDEPDRAHWGVTFGVDDADASPRARPSSAARCSWRRSTPRGCG